MLETKNLVKIYNPKKGVPVTALDNVNISFPEKGMVFLLGKSGSGKSTLLNLLGGLDNYNSGEIIIKGVSSKDFKQKHFDSYRNTYVGFIFQEYNVLDEFTVGANIALAIELQNRKATDSEINEILKEVDLEGFGKRRPNELSGGQKQRVAIARALVKKPEIIMADEPTGALDSVTGRQVLDTLKKLSLNRLVIVVSHDREFAESYADRIIELADGKVISDVEVSDENIDNDNKMIFGDSRIVIPEEYRLTDDDRKAILDYIESLQNGKVDLKININALRKFVPTKVKNTQYNTSQFKLIKSKLPLKNAFKIGAGALKFKKFRLVMTILLSCISFGLFGLSDTFGAYNHIKVCTNSLIDTEVKYIATAKAKRMNQGTNEYWRDYGYLISDAEIAQMNKSNNIEMQGVYNPIGDTMGFSTQINPEINLTETNYNIYKTQFSGFAPINNEILKSMGFKLLAGHLPTEDVNEVAISEYVFEVFKKANYTDGSKLKDKDGKETVKFDEIKTYDDILGKILVLNNQKYTITAVVDTNFHIDRYIDLIVKKDYVSQADQLVDMILFSEFDYASEYSYSGLAMVSPKHLNGLVSQKAPMSLITEGYISFNGNYLGADSNYLARLSDIKDEKIIWINGEKSALSQKEIIVTTDALNFWTDEENIKNFVFDENGEIDYIATLKKNNEVGAWIELFNDPKMEYEQEEGYKIVGIIDNINTLSKDLKKSDSKLVSTIVCADTLFSKLTEGKDYYYSFSVGALPEDKDRVEEIVKYCYSEEGDVRYPIKNSVTYELDSINEVLKSLSTVFLYIGLGFALFASLMLANFIGISISHKKQEIGILRAIGSRSNDVFRIFFSESFIIAMINFILSAIGVGVATAIINIFLRKELGILITVLSFTQRQIILLFAVSVLVAFVASFLPVKRIASKRPIDAIRNK